MEKNWSNRPHDIQASKKLNKALNINPIICQLLSQRGIQTFEQAKTFFRPKIENLHSPFLMQDMTKACDCLINVIESKKKVMVYGDYDVDGTCAVSMFTLFLQKLNIQCVSYIPDRHEEGYGISIKGIKEAKRLKIDLIISLDCGVKDFKAADLAHSSDIKLIICDHHLPSYELPKAFSILNPKRNDCSYPNPNLSGCGVGFKLMQAVVEKMNLEYEFLYSFLDFVSISIACDIVNVTGENRILAHFGLKQLEKTDHVGLKSLLSLCGLDKKIESGQQIDFQDLGFNLGPKINAAGRLGHAMQAVKILTSKNSEEGLAHTQNLNELNTNRRFYQNKVVEDIRLYLLNNTEFKEKCAYVFKSDQWHKGVVGIAAAIISEEQHKPCIILASNNGVLSGSARSIPGVDVHKAISEGEAFLERFGGHHAAAGLSVKEENLNAFIKAFETGVQKQIKNVMPKPEITYDAEVTFDQLTKGFYNVLKQMGPFGPGNNEPLFVCKDVYDTGLSYVVKKEHLKLKTQQKGALKSMQGIAFNQAKSYQKIQKNNTFSLCFSLKENYWNNRSSIEMMVKDIQF